MANPNNSEMKLRAYYGADEDTLQPTDVYSAMVDDADQIEHKFVEAVPVGGQYVELAHYSQVRQMIVQNMDTVDSGVVFWVDAVTAAIVPMTVLPGEQISFCVPNVTTGVMLYALANTVSFHLAFIGAR